MTSFDPDESEAGLTARSRVPTSALAPRSSLATVSGDATDPGATSSAFPAATGVRRSGRASRAGPGGGEGHHQQRGRTQEASAGDLRRAGAALSLLQERGAHPSRGPGALIDAAIAVGAVRIGALFVTQNAQDFAKLGFVLPLRWEAWATFAARAV